MGLRGAVKAFLTRRQDREYERRLASRQVTYGEWVAEYGDQELLAAEWDGEAEPEEDAVSDDEVVIFCASCGKMAEDAKKRIAIYFQKNPEILMVYGDEDVRDPESGELRSPWFKPDWSPDTLESWFYFGSLVAVRRQFLERCGCWEQVRKACGGAEKCCSPEYGCGVLVCAYPEPGLMQSWTEELTVMAGGYEKGCKAIGHLKKMVFHCEKEAQQEAYLHWKSRKSMRKPAPLPMVSVIIPSRDNPVVLEQGIRSFAATAGRIPYEILVVDNGSSPENKKRIQHFLKQLETESAENTGKIRYLYEPMEFHFSRMCNLGAGLAHGEVLLFLNDDVELCCEGWLERMVNKAVRPYAGAVGLKLCYPGARRIQHAGIINLPMGPVHKLQFLDDAEEYYFGRNRMDGNVLAVTGACLMVGADRFEEAGGFPEELAVAFNDVDLCFSLYEMGYQNVIVNSAYAYHHESLSRGDDESSQKQERLQGERKKLYERHPALEGFDPYYPEGLNRDGLDTRIRPAFLTSGNVPQQVCLQKQERRQIDLNQFREDPCLLIRVEYAGADGMQGYSVVLGDDNACYEKMLILCPVRQPEGAVSFREGYCIVTEEQYRPDLLENMSDQKNVALCGFWMKWAGNGLPAGNYRIAAAARNRVTGLKLINWSTRVLGIDKQDQEETDPGIRKD